MKNKNNAEELLNTIANITFHTKYELDKENANDEIKYINSLIDDYFKKETNSQESITMITLDEFEEKDLCFKYDDQLYDYDLLDDFYQDACLVLSYETDPVEFDMTLREITESVNTIEVFTKEYFKIPTDRIKTCIQDFIVDYWENEIDDIDVHYSDKAEECLIQFLKAVEEDNKIWRIDKKVGFMDLSKEVGKFIKEDYGDNE
jgi:hypothetical protein